MSNSETVLNGRYRLIAQQGSGGMAVIYKAVDLFLGRTVAVKVLRPRLTTDPTFVSKFRNEARSIANLSHPNIVTVHDVGNEGQTHYMVMEYVEGQDLKKIIRADGRLSIDRSLDLAIQICAGIGFAHRAQLVHADVKPQNILITKDFRVKVTDFGIAQALTDTQPVQRQDIVWGSPHYFAPEQARGEKPTAASDVYAIGIVIFEMLTGRLPYQGANNHELAMAHLREPVPLVSEFNPNVPEALARIIHKVMSKEPAARYRMADQLGQILRTYRDRSQAYTAANNPPIAFEQPEPSIPPPPVYRQSVPTTMGSRLVPPIANQPPRPSGGTSGVPTQQYGPAPVAPQPVQYRPTASMPNLSDSGVKPPWDGGGSSQPFTPPNYQQQSVPGSGLDVITIVLALLALIAVFGLIPLYIVVFRAWNGG